MRVELLEDAVVALLAAIGLGQLLWLGARLFWGLTPRRRMDHVAAVVPAAGGGAGLEQTVRAALWLRRTGLWRGEVVIEDQGLTVDGRALARLLAEEPGVSFTGDTGRI